MDGPVATVAPARKWERVSHAAVSLVQLACSAPLRRAKYRDVCRLSGPVASTAAAGLSPIRPRSVADVVAHTRRTTKSPFLRAAARRSTGSSSAGHL